MENLFKKIRKLIQAKTHILLISHKKPDADTLGSAIALKIILDRYGKKTVLACCDTPGSSFKFLPFISEFKKDFDLKSFDLVFILDAGASYMTNYQLKYPELFQGDSEVVNIDHHTSNDCFGKINIVDSKAPSTTIILYKMLKFWQENIDVEVATCLLAGIYGDTGGFMHSNTSKQVYKIAADLLAKGARLGEINSSLFRTKSISTLKLWGKVLENVHMTDQDVVISTVKESDYKEVNSDPGQLSGVIDYLNMIPNSKFALLVNEDRKGNLKGSLRTRNNDIDLSKIAATFGGGGHPKASGFTIKGRLK